MKTRITTSSLLLLVVLWSGYRAQTQTVRPATVSGLAPLTLPIKQADSLPKICILYPPGGNQFDRQCPELMKTPIKPEWMQETVQRLPEFRAAWEKDGQTYLASVISETGLQFPYREAQVTLTVCPALRGMSLPLLINVLPYLTSVHSDSQKFLPIEILVETIFHELMHHYTPRVYAGSTLYKKYRAEAPAVLSHLHVAALEKFALTKSGKTDVLKFIDQVYRNSTFPGYKRAWEIVNDIERHEDFINELKLLRK